tara:strand:+ start:342 stop:1199 length:858 start_codon:yes stop_codon:yes gene_type:complete
LIKIIKEYFYLFKVHHWIKNLIIFLPILVGHSFLSSNIINYIVYFLILSFLSSIIYFFNNLNDYKEDTKNKELKYKLNLEKKRNYYIFGIVIFFILINITFFINQTIFIICFFYFLLSLFYNFYLKRKKYLDIFILSLFHILRIVYGSIAFNVELSAYFILFCSAIFLMIGSNKRLIEIDSLYTNRPYKIDDKRKIQIFQLFSGIFAILVFFLYSVDPAKNQFFIFEEIIYVNLILIILIIVNFLFFQKDRNQDIIIFIYNNKINFFLVVVFLIIYVGNSVSFYN